MSQRLNAQRLMSPHLLLIASVLLASVSLAETAPNWILPDANDKSVSFYEDAQNHPVLLIFPSPGCNQTCVNNLTHWAQTAAELQIKTYWLSRGRSPALAPEGTIQLYNARPVARKYGAINSSRVVLVNGEQKMVWSGPAQSEPTSVLAVWQSLWLMERN